MRNPLKLKKNKTFSYSPRYYKGEGNPYKIEHKLDKFRTTAHTKRGIKISLLRQWRTLRPKVIKIYDYDY